MLCPNSNTNTNTNNNPDAYADSAANPDSGILLRRLRSRPAVVPFRHNQSWSRRRLRTIARLPQMRIFVAEKMLCSCS